MEATGELEQDEVLRSALGEGRNEDYVDYFIRVKREEWNRYHEQVTPWEIAEYLTRFWLVEESSIRIAGNGDSRRKPAPIVYRNRP